MTLLDVKNKIKEAQKTALEKNTNVTLVAVSKTQPIENIENLIKEGQKTFGENRIQEATEKFTVLRQKYPDIELHFIGHLQTNKAKDAVALFDVIESLDSPKLAKALSVEMKKQNRQIPCYIQVNTGEEPQKSGILPKDLKEFYNICHEELGLSIEGLMCIPPQEEIPDLHFALLHKLSKELNLKTLSMGMSADFETAIRYGASHIRVGTALFGTRKA